ncbi:lysozyme inhibitor LprI family protein [Chromobacterium alticapitis]|nr:lysozyme inhibitor LprI family protein [Chromobacterium alticapitis]
MGKLGWIGMAGGWLMAASSVLAGPEQPEYQCGQQYRTTQDISDCLGKVVDNLELELTRYLEAAQRRIDRENDKKPDLQGEQAAWRQCVSAHCGDAYDYWRDGSIPYIEAPLCSIRLARERTHHIWEAFLTYPDSTPPLLPEPQL